MSTDTLTLERPALTWTTNRDVGAALPAAATTSAP